MDNITPEELKARKEQWRSLSSKQKKIRLERVFRIVRKVAKTQLALLEKYNKSKKISKTIRHLYFFVTVRSFWEDADFALALGKKKYKKYAVCPARTLMEKTLRIIWFTRKKSEQEQDVLAKKDLLSKCLISYRREEKHKRPKEQAVFKDYYDSINDIGLPPIDEAKKSDLEAFPSCEEMCNKSGIPGTNILYDSYRDLCGMIHGDFLSTVINQQAPDSETYSFAMVYVLRFCVEMIKVTDFHLGQQTKEDVAKAIEAGKEISFG